MLTKNENRDLVSERLQQTNGQSGEVISLKTYGDPGDLPVLLNLAAEAHAWEMFPDGGWHWCAAFDDFVLNHPNSTV